MRERDRIRVTTCTDVLARSNGVEHVFDRVVGGRALRSTYGFQSETPPFASLSDRALLGAFPRPPA